MDENLIKKQYNQIRNLKQNRGKSHDQLWAIAKDRVLLHDPDLNVDSLFNDKKDRKKAADLLQKYLTDYIIETISDKNTLKYIVQLEILHEKLFEKLKIDGYDAVPVKSLDALHKNLDEIIKLKNILKAAKEQVDDVTVLNRLKAKFKVWLRDNPDCRHMLCPHCQKMVLLRIRTDKYDAVKHPFFKGRILYSPHLMHLYKTNIITREDVAKIFDCSTDYADWVIQKIEGTPSNETITPEISGQI